MIASSMVAINDTLLSSLKNIIREFFAMLSCDVIDFMMGYNVAHWQPF
jgi:hypothetical protein